MTAHDPLVTLTEAERDALDGPLPLGGFPDLLDDVASVVESIIAARLAPIRALADEWGAVAAGRTEITEPIPHTFARALRAALDATGADLSASQECRSCDDAGYLQGGQRDGEECPACTDLTASQDHDGAEGQGEGERAGEGDQRLHDLFLAAALETCHCGRAMPCRHHEETR